MMNSKTYFYRAALPAAAALMLSTAATQAAVVESLVLEVEGALSFVDFGGAVEVNNDTGATTPGRRGLYTDVSGLVVHNAVLSQTLGATTGAMRIDIDDTGDVSFANCGGILSSMCASGNTNIVDFASGSLVSHDWTSRMSSLDSTSFTYIDDSSYTWDIGSSSFFNSIGVTVEYDISSASVSAVPLPASMAFFLGAFGLMFGMRKRANG